MTEPKSVVLPLHQGVGLNLGVCSSLADYRVFSTFASRRRRLDLVKYCERKLFQLNRQVHTLNVGGKLRG